MCPHANSGISLLNASFVQILGQLLDARQLGLKLIANVTYGYTSANFSGRMPCVEVLSLIIGSPTISGINSFLFNKIILLLSPRLHCLRAVRSCMYLYSIICYDIL